MSRPIGSARIRKEQNAKVLVCDLPFLITNSPMMSAQRNVVKVISKFSPLVATMAACKVVMLRLTFTLTTVKGLSFALRILETQKRMVCACLKPSRSRTPGAKLGVKMDTFG